MTGRRAIACTMVVALTTTACGEDSTESSPTSQGLTTTRPTSPTESTQTAPTQTEPEVTMPSDVPEVVRLAIADLADHTGADPASITVSRHESVTWRDGSIGCPEPGMSYTMALVPGYRIELVLDGVSHWYHGARDRPPFRCVNPVDPFEGAGTDI